MLEVNVENQLIRLRGNLVASVVRSVFHKTPTFAGKSMNVDLSEIQEVDSAGLALLVHWYNLASRDNCTLIFNDCPANLTKIAELCDLEDLFGSRQEAL